MSFWSEMLADVEKGILFVTKLVEAGVPFAEIAGSVSGNPEVSAAAGAAGVLAAAADKAITDHQAVVASGGSMEQSALKTMVDMADATAKSGLLDPVTAAKITTAVVAAKPLVSSGAFTAGLPANQG